MKFQIQKDILIHKPAAEVYAILSDITKWNVWSPWIHCEPTTKCETQGAAGQVGQTQVYEGEVIGAGKLTIADLLKNKRIQMKLEFFKPWKSLAEAIFDIEAIDANQCKVTWTMNSNMPLFMIFFKKMMQAYMGSDFWRGLSMLKEYAETGAVVSKSTYEGEKELSGFQVLGQRTKTTISELSTRIRADFENMSRRLEKGEITQPAFIVSLFHDHNIPKGTSEFTAGYAYKLDQKVNVPAGFELLQIPNYKGLTVEHLGPYRNIGNPWSMAMSYQRTKKKKLNKSIPMHEIYKTMPGGNEKDIKTQIVMPIK